MNSPSFKQLLEAVEARHERDVTAMQFAGAEERWELMANLRETIKRMRGMEEDLMQCKEMIADLDAKRNERIAALVEETSRLEEAVSNLLGYEPSYAPSNNLYRLLPINCLNADVYNERVRDIERSVDAGEGVNSRLISFMRTFTPIDQRAFHAKLHPLLDRLLEVLKERRSIEMQCD